MRTESGTWAVSQAEADIIESIVDSDEKWESSLKGKDQWLLKPAQPPGLLRSGKHSQLCNIVVLDLGLVSIRHMTPQGISTWWGERMAVLAGKAMYVVNYWCSTAAPDSGTAACSIDINSFTACPPA